MPSVGTPTAELTTQLAEPRGQRDLPAVWLAGRMATARENLCACREHLLSAADAAEPVPDLLAEVEALIRLSDAIMAVSDATAGLDGDMGGGLPVLAAVFRAKCAIFVQRLDGLVQEKHSRLAK